MLSTRLLNDPTEFSLLFFSGGGAGGAGRIIQAPEWHSGACSSSWGGLLLGKMGGSACISGGMRVGNGFLSSVGKRVSAGHPCLEASRPGVSVLLYLRVPNPRWQEGKLGPPPRSPRSPQGKEELGEIEEAGPCPRQLRLAV